MVAFVAAGAFANIYPFAPRGYTEVLAALYLPIALWMVVGIAYAGGRWSQVAGRMDFIRFSGELFIYYVLIALGGGVLTAFMQAERNIITAIATLSRLSRRAVNRNHRIRIMVRRSGAAQRSCAIIGL